MRSARLSHTRQCTAATSCDAFWRVATVHSSPTFHVPWPPVRLLDLLPLLTTSDIQQYMNTDELTFSASFPLPFRVLCLAALGILGWATNLHGLHAWGVDAAGVLELNAPDTAYRLASPLPAPASSSSSSLASGSASGTTARGAVSAWRHPAQTYEPVYRVCAAFAAWAGACWVAYALAVRGAIAAGAGAGMEEGYGYARAGAAVDEYKFVPGVAALCALMVLVCPFQVCYKAQRDKFIA